MPEQQVLHLINRAVVKLAGSDAESLLQRLITNDLNDLNEGELRYGALLTPQGKVALDFLLSRHDGGFLFDLDRDILSPFIMKMGLYRMRSDVSIEEQKLDVGVVFDTVGGTVLDDGIASEGIAVRDTRSDLLGWRIYGVKGQWQTNQDLEGAYLERHLAAFVPQAGLDFALGDVFPYDINMDYFGALDFEKGCYVGQEVVSRMHHRGTARKRLVRLEADDSLPMTGTAVLAGEKPVGVIGAVMNNKALAIVRLDRVAEAQAEGLALTADGILLRMTLPDYADFTVSS